MKTLQDFVSTSLLVLISLGLIGCVGGDPEPPAAGAASAEGGAAAPDTAESRKAVDLLKAVFDKYGKMKSIKVEGTSSASTNGKTASSTTTFSIALIRDPRAYRVHWEKSAPIQMSGTLWNSGDGPNLDMGLPGFDGKQQDEMMAFAKATGVSGGAAATLPALFYQDMKWGQTSMPDSGQFKGEETIGGVKCRIVESPVRPGLIQRFWIDGENLIRRKQDLIDMGAMELPEMTPQKIDETLKKMGKEPNEQNRAQLKAMMDKAREQQKVLQANPVKSTLTQDYTKIEVNAELNPADFGPKSE